jgi:phage-related protein
MSLKGPIEKDRVLLTPIGNAIMDGLHDGLTQGYGRVQSMLAGVAGDMNRTLSTAALHVAMPTRVTGGGYALNGAGTASSTFGGGSALTAGGSTVIVNVNVAGSVAAAQDLAATVRQQLLKRGRQIGVLGLA